MDEAGEGQAGAHHIQPLIILLLVPSIHGRLEVIGARGNRLELLQNRTHDRAGELIIVHLTSGEGTRRQHLTGVCRRRASSGPEIRGAAHHEDPQRWCGWCRHPQRHAGVVQVADDANSECDTASLLQALFGPLLAPK